MELVQWIVPRADGSLGVLWAPVWADRVQGAGDEVVRRRGAPLVSRWLPAPLALGSTEAPPDPEAAPLLRGTLAAVFSFAADAADPRPVLGHHVDDVRFASVLAELVRVVADLSEAAGLPAAQLRPTPERTGLEVRFGAVGVLTGAQVADALILLRAAVESCLLARGLILTGARVRNDDGAAPLDGRVAELLVAPRGPR